eukprot:TRINITY_DN33770_c0_g1_i1.p1 TRINITY_DN33770_c0_g1~~TRINITY_DN33770_c0_g1_i1.p1  ORF type:complete len:382 (+),score=72.04 TRINITY_DN33770_c0_g1_i1:28-1173(+)
MKGKKKKKTQQYRREGHATENPKEKKCPRRGMNMNATHMMPQMTAMGQLYTNSYDAGGQAAMHPMVLSQKVEELSKDKMQLKGELEGSREETLTVKRQLQETLENVSVLEEGQIFLLEKHKQVVSEYHRKLKKTGEDLKTASQQNQQLQEALHQVQQQPPVIQQDPSSRVEVAQLLTVIEDLQKAIDEKNDLIDMLSTQVSQLQQATAVTKSRQEETEMDLQRTRIELDNEKRNARQPHPSQKPILDNFHAYLTHRDSVRDGQIEQLTETMKTLKTQVGSGAEMMGSTPAPMEGAEVSTQSLIPAAMPLPAATAAAFPLQPPQPAQPPPSILSMVSQRGPPLSPPSYPSQYSYYPSLDGGGGGSGGGIRPKAILSPPKPFS